MGFPPKTYCKEIDILVEDFWKVIESRNENTVNNSGHYYTNDKIICALEIVKTRAIASEILIVKSDSER